MTEVAQSIVAFIAGNAIMVFFVLLLLLIGFVVTLGFRKEKAKQMKEGQ